MKVDNSIGLKHGRASAEGKCQALCQKTKGCVRTLTTWDNCRLYRKGARTLEDTGRKAKRETCWVKSKKCIHSTTENCAATTELLSPRELVETSELESAPATELWTSPNKNRIVPNGWCPNHHGYGPNGNGKGCGSGGCGTCGDCSFDCNAHPGCQSPDSCTARIGGAPPPPPPAVVKKIQAKLNGCKGVAGKTCHACTCKKKWLYKYAYKKKWGRWKRKWGKFSGCVKPDKNPGAQSKKPWCYVQGKGCGTKSKARGGVNRGAYWDYCQ